MTDTRTVTGHINLRHAQARRVTRMRRPTTIAKAAVRIPRRVAAIRLRRARTRHPPRAVTPHLPTRLLLVPTQRHRDPIRLLPGRTLRRAAATVVAVEAAVMVGAAVTAEGEEALAAAAAAAGRTAAGRTVVALTATKSWDNKPARSSSGLFCACRVNIFACWKWCNSYSSQVFSVIEKGRAFPDWT